MIGRKRKNRNLDNIGKDIYNFDFSLEKNVYKNLCCFNVKDLDEQLKFNSYKEWNQYITNKYSNLEEYPTDKLKEFSRYLNQRLRINKPNHEYWNICITVIITWFFTKLLDWIFASYIYDQNFSFATNVITAIFVTVILIVLIFFLLWKMYDPILDSNIEESFLIDYKEIIDEMIKKRL